MYSRTSELLQSIDVIIIMILLLVILEQVEDFKYLSD